MAVRRVTDNPHVDPVATAYVLGDDARRAAEEVRWSAPPGGIGDILVGGVGGIAVLVDKVPETLRCEVEDLGSRPVARADRGLVKVVKCRRVCLTEIREGNVD